MRMVIREGQCKGIGILSRVRFPSVSSPCSTSQIRLVEQLIPEDSPDAHRHPHQKSTPVALKEEKEKK